MSGTKPQERLTSSPQLSRIATSNDRAKEILHQADNLNNNSQPTSKLVRLVIKETNIKAGAWDMDHTIVHFEIPADDVEKLREFYSKLFGWKIEKFPGPMDYWLIHTVPVDDKGMPLRPGVNGGMFKKERPENKPVNYISVESIDKCIEQVKALGGKIAQEKQEVQGVGWVAIALDPEGNQIAMLQPAQM